MNNTLFDEFSQVSAKQWKQLIQYDLKGADYNETLVWKTDEDIDVKPFYHADEYDSLGDIPLVSEWQIGQSIFVANVDKSNQKAVNAILRGAESIKFVLPSPGISIKDLLVNINLCQTKVYLDCQFLSNEFVDQLKTFHSREKLIIQTDIIGRLGKTGNWFQDLKSDHEIFSAFVEVTDTLTIHMDLYQNAGATIVQQLAYGMAHANEYLNHFDTRLSDGQKNSVKVVFNVAVGTNYFFEIAKLRALRKLWSSISHVYGFNTECLIFAEPSKRNKTLYDYNTNMLRTTTECMSAILGGANTVCNLPYDGIYHKDNEFAERIARNQLLILKNESYFDKVSNPVDGAYYIETITEQLAESALSLFKDIEAQGGFLKQLKEGTIQRKIKESAAHQQQQFDSGNLVLLGTNKHPNLQDKMKDELEIFPFMKKNPVKTLIEPIIERRLSEELEQKRLEDE